MTIRRFTVDDGLAAGCVVYEADNLAIKALAREWNACRKAREIHGPAGPVLVTYHRPF